MVCESWVRQMYMTLILKMNPFDIGKPWTKITRSEVTFEQYKMALNLYKYYIEFQYDDAIKRNRIFFDFMQWMFNFLDGLYIHEILVPWLASTATFRPPLNAGSMALGSTTCWGQRHGVGTGGNGEQNGGGIRREWQGIPGTDMERRKGSRTETRRPTEGEREKSTVGGKS